MPETKQRETPVIRIDTNKKCSNCGKKESCENGLCMSCSMKLMTAKFKKEHDRPMETITEPMIAKAVDRLQKHLFDHHLEIDKAYNNLEEDETGYKIEKLAVSLKVKFEQMGNKIAMQTEIAFSTGKVKDGDKVIFDDKQPKLGEEY